MTRHAKSFEARYFGDAGNTPVAELMAVAEERAARWLRERGFEPLWLYPIPDAAGGWQDPALGASCGGERRGEGAWVARRGCA